MLKIVKVASLLILAAGLISGCVASATPEAPPLAPTQPPPAPATQTVAAPTQPVSQSQAAPTPAGGKTVPGGSVKRGNVLLDFKGVSYDANKKQAILNLAGSLPTPCHKLQTEVSPPDARSQIAVSVYTLVDPTLMCAQVIKPFETAVPLGALAAGSYTVSVNGEPVGEVKVP
jgi:hypothetical protein